MNGNTIQLGKFWYHFEHKCKTKRKEIGRLARKKSQFLKAIKGQIKSCVTKRQYKIYIQGN